MIVHIIDTLGAITGITGVIGVGRKDKRGYILLFICNLCYLTIGFVNGNFGLVVVSIVMGFLDVKYYFKWKKDDDKSRQ